MASYPEGPLRTINASFLDINGDPIDYTIVQFSYTVARAGVWPVNVIYSGAPTAVGVIVRSAQGLYQIQVVTLGVSGKWTWEWQGIDSVGNIQAQESGAFTITPKNPALF